MPTVKSGGILTGEIIWQTPQGQKIRHSQPPRGRISLKETSSVSAMQVQETDTPVTTSEKHNESGELGILPPSENAERRSTLKKLFGALLVPRLQKMAESKAKEELENELYLLRVQSGVNLRGVNTSYLTVVYTVAQASLIAAIIKYLIYLYLDRKQQYYISMYKAFVNNLFKLNIRALKYNLRLSRTFANQYRKSQTSKQWAEKFKSFEAVIKFLATVPLKTTIETNFSYA